MLHRHPHRLLRRGQGNLAHRHLLNSRAPPRDTSSKAGSLAPRRPANSRALPENTGNKANMSKPPRTTNSRTPQATQNTNRKAKTYNRRTSQEASTNKLRKKKPLLLCIYLLEVSEMDSNGQGNKDPLQLLAGFRDHLAKSGFREEAPLGSSLNKRSAPVR